MPVISRTSSSLVCFMTLVTFVVFLRVIAPTATLLMLKATRPSCRGSSDAALLPYHVDRSKLFVMDRLSKIKSLDATRVANAIEFTRFPPSHGPDDNDNEEGMLVRAADLIGQLGDPHYLRKANALYYEFEEVGMNKQLGYTSPADLTDLYPQFYWSSISAHIQSAIRYLNVTSSGRQWIANLYSNIFRAERDLSLCGPQR